MKNRGMCPNMEPSHWAKTLMHVLFFLHWLQLKIEMLFHPQLHICIILNPEAAPTLITVRSGVQSVAMRARWLQRVEGFFFVFSPFYFLKTCIAILFLFASNENPLLYTWHPTALPLSHLSFSSLFSLASLLNGEIRAWILIHVGKVHVS